MSAAALEMYKRNKAERNMRVFDALPKPLRKAVSGAHYSCWEVHDLAAQVKQRVATAALVRNLKAADEKLRQQRIRY